MRPLFTLLIVAAWTTLAASFAPADETQPLRPGRFAIIFNAGYAGDHLPQEKEAFEEYVKVLRQANFNVLLCKYEPWRAEICTRHGMQIVVDLLVGDHHVYKNVEGAKKLCESLKGEEAIYAYHLWSDNIGETYSGRSRDVKNVRGWDGTHPVYVGTYRMSRVNRVEGLDLLGYYDFHWKRGGHWGHLTKASSVARGKDALFLRYCEAAPGRVGIGNVNRCGYTIATSIPFGLKGYTFHYGGGVVDQKAWQLDALGKDLQIVNANFAPLGDELMKIGNPLMVYSTPITKTAKDRPTENEPAVPAGLTAIPGDHWFQIAAGEVLLGEFEDSNGRTVLALASHNAYQPQKVAFEFTTPVKELSVFNREKGAWENRSVKEGKATINVGVFAAELVRIDR